MRTHTLRGLPPFRNLLAVAPLLCAAMGCASIDYAPPVSRVEPPDDLDQRFARAVELWASHHVTSYLIHVESHSSWAPATEMTVRVIDGYVVSVIAEDERGFQTAPIGAVPVRPYPITVEYLFDRLRQWGPRGAATFDETWGYPLYVRLGNPDMDYGDVYIVSRFQVLDLE
jgi:hypothetical protein